MSRSGKRLNTVIKAVITVAVVAVLIVIPLALMRKDITYQSPTMYSMDTTLDITVQGRGEKTAQDDFSESYRLAKKIESYTSRFDPESDVANINRNAGGRAVKVHPETLEIISESLEYSRLTDGAFDITIAPVAGLWGFYDKKYRVPAKEEIRATLPLVDWRKVEVDEKEGTIRLASPGMGIDLGGVAKGYAAGAISDLLRERGVRHGLVNFGGAVGAVGNRADGKPWVVGIKSPRGKANSMVGRIKAVDDYVSSSGDYERYFIRDGRRYYHIFDPKTGRQPTGAMDATVVGPDSLTADILSTSIFVMGRDRGFELIGTQPGYQAVFIDDRGDVSQTGGMGKYVIDMDRSVK